MATLCIKTGMTPGYEIQFFDTNGKRLTIYLGGRRYTEKTARELKEIVEELVLCRDNPSQQPRKSTLKRIDEFPQDIQQKFAGAGLIAIPPSHTLKELWDMFLEQKGKEVKESTLKLYECVRDRFFLFFKPEESLNDLTKERMQKWKDHLLDEVATATVACYIKEAKTCFNWATDHGWWTESPLDGIAPGSFVNKKNDRIIPMNVYYRLLDGCPCQDWRTILALARIGGLRCPNEVLNLRWEDVNWEHNRFLVRSPKTEHHEGKDGRWVPIFPELREELETLFFSVASEGREFVINRYRSASQNLRTTLEKIVHRAGLEIFPRPFDNLRMTRSNEVYREFGAFAESQWIGHSSRVRADHYLMITDDDFHKASGWSTELGKTVCPKPERQVKSVQGKIPKNEFPCTIPCSMVRK